MTWVLVVGFAALFVGMVAGFVVGLVCRDASVQDDSDLAYRALCCVQAENGGLTESTRRAVIEAIADHRSRRFPQ